MSFLFSISKFLFLPLNAYTDFCCIFGSLLQGLNLHTNRDKHQLQKTVYASLKGSYFEAMSPWSNMNKQIWCFQNLFNQDSMFFLLLPLLVVQPYMCARLHQHPLHISRLWAGVCVIMYAEAQGYSFGHWYELFMEWREILKIYFFLSANYSV